MKYNIPSGFKEIKKMKSCDNYCGLYVIAQKKEDILLLIFDGISSNPTALFRYKEINDLT